MPFHASANLVHDPSQGVGGLVRSDGPPTVEGRGVVWSKVVPKTLVKPRGSSGVVQDKGPGSLSGTETSGPFIRVLLRHEGQDTEVSGRVTDGIPGYRQPHLSDKTNFVVRTREVSRTEEEWVVVEVGV